MRLEGQRIAVYCRYSTDRQNDRSVEDQLRLCRQYVQRLGGSVSPDLVFTDAAVSGTGDSMLRPGFQALHRAVRERRVDVVVTEDLSRVSRDLESTARMFRQFQSWGARLLAVDGFDTSAPQSKLIGALKGAMGEMYVDELRQRTKRGLDGNHLAGLHTGGRAYGYRIVDKRLRVDEAEAVVVRRIFADCAAGVAQRVIAERLNAAGVRAPRGGQWSHMTVRAVLRNELYVGRVVFNRRQWGKDHDTGKRTKRDRPRAEWLTRAEPDLRIVDDETWGAVRARLVEVGRTYARGERPKAGYPLSGLLACGLCGEPMTMHGQGAYYACSGRKKGHACANGVSLRERAIRAWLIDQIRDRAGAADLLERLRASWAEDTGARDRELRAELQQRRAALTSTEAQVGRLLDFVAAGNDTPSTRAKLREKEDHADLQRAAIARIEAELRRVPSLPSTAELRAFLDALPDAVLRLPDETRAVLRRLLVGPVKCFPPAQRGGDYRVRFDLDPRALLATEPASGALETGSARGGCGGAIVPLADVVAVDGLCPARYGA